MRNVVTIGSRTWYSDSILSGAGSLHRSSSLDGRRLSVDSFSVGLTSFQALDQTPQNASVTYAYRRNRTFTGFVQSVEQVQPPRRYTVSAFSALGLLMQREHRGGVYNGIRADALMAEICGNDIAHGMEDEFRSTPVYGYLPIQPARDALLQLLFALNACLASDIWGRIWVRNLPTSPKSVIDADKMYAQGAKVVTLPPVTAVTVVEHQYLEVASVSEETLFQGTAASGQIITFDRPMFSLSASGFAITSSNANYAVLSAGTGVLTGKPYTHVTREITRTVTSAPVPNVERIENATLVGVTASADVADRLAEYYRHRTWIQADVLTTTEAPGDVVSLCNPWTREQVTACIEESTTILSSVLKSSISALVGFTPWQTIPFEDVREVLTGSGTWTVPAGVTRVTAVLIGGGDGGQPGQAGGLAVAPLRTGSVSSSEATTYFSGFGYASSGDYDPSSLTGGKGGLPGTPGGGGKILRVDIEVSPGGRISYACGVGGTGAPFGGGAAGSGGATTFGSSSSATGAASDSGYVDPITGVNYALPGASGVAGGDGASPGVTPAPVVVGGVSWSAGTHPSGEIKDGAGDQSWDGYKYYRIEGSYGGGAAYQANGGNGKLDGSGQIDSSSVAAYASSNGAGATASAPAASAGIGKGGTGGNGGGGQGSIGPTFAACRVFRGNDPADRAAHLPTTPGQPGNGSAGGKGGPGGIILYYRRPV